MPEHPYLMPYFRPERKQAGDNADALVSGAFIDGRATHRIVGHRGSATWLAITVLRETRPDEPRHPMGAPYNYVLAGPPLFLPDMEVSWDGSFEVTLSPERHPGNWIPTTPETTHVRIRQFFGNWEQEEPATIRIEREGDVDPPPLLTPERWTDRLQEVAAFVESSASFWPAIPNGLPLNDVRASEAFDRPSTGSWDGKVDANPGGVNASCHWRVGRDQALVVEWTPTPAYFWLVELDTMWAATIDYRWRLSNLNAKQAAYEHDGSVRMVLSHADPGVPNWLDLSGWSEGYLNIRMLLCTDVPAFSTRLVCLDELPRLLPPDARRIDAAGRRDQLRLRKIGVDKRFGT